MQIKKKIIYILTEPVIDPPKGQSKSYFTLSMQLGGFS